MLIKMKLMQRQITKFIKKCKPHVTNVFWSNLNQAVITMSSLGVLAIFTNLAEKELFGQYLFIEAVIGVISIVSIPGVGPVIFRSVSQQADGVYRKAIRFSFLWSLVSVGLVLAIGGYYCVFGKSSYGLSLLFCALFIPFVSSLKNWMWLLKGQRNFKKLTAYNAIKLSVNMIAILLAVIFSKNLIIILVAYFSTNSAFNVFCYLRSLKLLRNNEIDAKWKNQCYALTIMDFSGVVFGKVDIILLGTLLPIEQVALYGLVMKLGETFFSVIRSSVEGILPDLFKSKKVAAAYFLRFFAVSFLIPVGLYPVIRYPIQWICPKYLDVVAYCQVYLFAIPFYFFNSIVNAFLVKHKLNVEINISRILSLVCVLILYVILIPKYGIWGGVISSMLYFAIQLFLNFLLLVIRGPRQSAIETF